MNDFMELAHYEFDYALRKSTFERWVERVEAIIDHDLDGNQQTDGYSLDFALDEFNAGKTPQEYAASIRKVQP